MAVRARVVRCEPLLRSSHLWKERSKFSHVRWCCGGNKFTLRAFTILAVLLLCSYKLGIIRPQSQTREAYAGAPGWVMQERATAGGHAPPYTTDCVSASAIPFTVTPPPSPDIRSHHPSPHSQLEPRAQQLSEPSPLTSHFFLVSAWLHLHLPLRWPFPSTSAASRSTASSPAPPLPASLPSTLISPLHRLYCSLPLGFLSSQHDARCSCRGTTAAAAAARTIPCPPSPPSHTSPHLRLLLAADRAFLQACNGSWQAVICLGQRGEEKEVGERERGEREGGERDPTSDRSSLHPGRSIVDGMLCQTDRADGPGNASEECGGNGREGGGGKEGSGDGDGSVPDSVVSAAWRSDVCFCLSDDYDVHARKHRQVQVFCPLPHRLACNLHHRLSAHATPLLASLFPLSSPPGHASTSAADAATQGGSRQDSSSIPSSGTNSGSGIVGDSEVRAAAATTSSTATASHCRCQLGVKIAAVGDPTGDAAYACGGKDLVMMQESFWSSFLLLESTEERQGGEVMQDHESQPWTDAELLAVLPGSGAAAQGYGAVQSSGAAWQGSGNRNETLRVGVCTGPLFGDVAVGLVEWLLFCLHMGAHIVFLYVIDSPSYPLSPLSRAVLRHVMQQHPLRVRVTLWNIPLAEGRNPSSPSIDMHYRGQRLFLTDCYLRAHAHADTVLFLDIDEFLTPFPHSRTRTHVPQTPTSPPTSTRHMADDLAGIDSSYVASLAGSWPRLLSKVHETSLSIERDECYWIANCEVEIRNPVPSMWHVGGMLLSFIPPFLVPPSQYFLDPSVGMLLFRTWWYPTTPHPPLPPPPSPATLEKIETPECLSVPSCCSPAGKNRDHIHRADHHRQAVWQLQEKRGLEESVLQNNIVRDRRLRDSRRRAKYALKTGDAVAFHIHGPVQMREGQHVQDVPILNAYVRHYTSTYNIVEASFRSMRTQPMTTLEIDESLKLASLMLHELQTFWNAFNAWLENSSDTIIYPL